MLKSKVLKTIKENNLIKKGDKIILGISGGPDSVCLLNILYSLKKELGLKIILTHVNYNFRGQDSKRDERLVKKIAKQKKIKLYIKNINPKNYQKNNIEEHFRDIRYKFFKKILKLEKAQKIALAHNKDDQAETILMFFLRGSGLAGISGMKIKNDKVIRPLLSCSKKEILTFIKENKLDYREDKSNKDEKFTRNKIRHSLMPFLEKNFNPNIKNTLFESAQIIRNDQELLSSLTKKKFGILAKEKEGEIIINLEDFKNLDIALQNRLINYTATKFKEKISSSLLKEILKITKQSRKEAKKYSGKLEIVKNYDKITFRKKKNIKKIKLTDLKIGEITPVNNSATKIGTKKVDRQGKISKNECYIDLKKTGNKLFIRSRKKGDRFYPQGIQGSQKLKDFFINNKIPAEKRNQIPLIVNGKDEIVWIVGRRVDRRFQPKNNLKNILKLQII